MEDGAAQGLAALAAAHPALRVLEPGDAIYHQGDPSHWVFNLVSGWVVLQQDLSDGGRHILKFVLPGGVFGLEPEGCGLGHSALALTTATVCAIRRPRHDRLRREHPSFNERFLWLLQRDVRAAQDRLTCLGQGSAATRVAHLIWELAVCGLGRRPLPGERVWAPVTQIQIASATGLTPIHVNRMLRRFRQQGLLEFHSPDLVVADPAELERLSGVSDDMLALWTEAAAPARRPPQRGELWADLRAELQ